MNWFYKISQNLFPGNVNHVNNYFKQHGLGQYKIVRGKGYFYFDGPGTETWHSSSVYVYNINQLSLEQWLNALRDMIKSESDSDNETKDMALPYQDKYPPEYHVDELGGGLYGMHLIDNLMSQDVAEEEEKRLGKMELIKPGNMGVVYQLDDQRVVKYTSCVDEYRAAMELFARGNPVPCLVKVLSMPLEIGYLYVIELEKVRPLTKEERIEYTKSSFAIKKNNLMNCIMKIGSHEDIHSGNIGYRGDELVVLDLGGLFLW